jgi:tetratricopeptide (TPR) repeat protein
MGFDAETEIFNTAEKFFTENKYAEAEPLLNQLVLKNIRRPEVFHMLGTIYYDQGKFNKAIRSFRRALELDARFTDSSIGLSIILNDLGRYEEGQKVFDEARALLTVKNPTSNAALNEKFASRHEDLGDMYLKHQRPQEALEQFQKALALTTTRHASVGLSIATCFVQTKDFSRAIRELRSFTRDYPNDTALKLLLGKCYYDVGQIPEALEQWEAVLALEPNNQVATDYLRLAQSIHVTHLNAPQIDL